MTKMEKMNKQNWQKVRKKKIEAVLRARLQILQY